MRFPNAYKGMKKYFVGIILTVFAIVAQVAAMVLAALPTAKDPGSPMAITALVITIASLVIICIAFILQLIGCFQAGRDQSYFHGAACLTIFALIASIAFGIIGIAVPSFEQYNSIIDSAASLIDLVAVVLVFSGVIVLSRELENFGFANFGAVLRMITLLISIVTVGLKLVPVFFTVNDETVKNVLMWIAISAAGVELIVELISGVFFGRAVSILKKK